MVLFNNCHNRPHQALYGSSAFFDLDRSGMQGAQARNLAAGAICVVASWEKEAIAFDYWVFDREEIKPSPEGTDVRVFCGTFNKRVVLSPDEARGSTDYGVFFDDRGRFKQTSVVRGS